MPIELAKKISNVTSERAFIPATGAGPSLLIRLVTQVSSSQPQLPTDAISALQPSGPVNQPASVTQPVDVPGVMPLAQPTHQTTTSQDDTRATDMSDVQSTRLVGHTHQQGLAFIFIDWYCSLTELSNSIATPTSPAHPMEEEGEVSDQDIVVPEREMDQLVSEEQTHRETIRAVSSFVGWKHVPEIESSSSSHDDNPFVGTRTQPTLKVSDEWLCRKMEKLNITLAEGYCETSELSRDQFVKVPKTLKWYDIYAERQFPVQSLLLD